MPKILVVDDEEEIRNPIAFFLTHRNFDVITATNGVEALTLIHSDDQKPDLIVTDEAMAEMTGTVLLQTLRHEVITIPVILMGGQIADWRVEQLKDLGFAEVLQKPFSIKDVLLPMIEKTLQP